MATDATGTPTTLGIPTFNVDVDSPSGAGSNAQMEAIDDLIVADRARLTTAESDIDTLQAAAAGADGWTAAGETWTYASADDPTFTFTISGDLTTKYAAGQRIKLTQTTAKYFIITAVSYSNPNTTITVYGGTDYDLANAAITSPYYSREKAPVGFPLNPIKWTVESTGTGGTQAAAVSTTYYNVGGSIAIPIGAWDVYYQGTLTADSPGSGNTTVYCTLSTSSSSASDTTWNTLVGGASLDYVYAPTHRRGPLVLAAKTTYYLNVMTDVGSSTIGFSGTRYIRAICAYL